MNIIDIGIISNDKLREKLYESKEGDKLVFKNRLYIKISEYKCECVIDATSGRAFIKKELENGAVFID